MTITETTVSMHTRGEVVERLKRKNDKHALARHLMRIREVADELPECDAKREIEEILTNAVWGISS